MNSKKIVRHPVNFVVEWHGDPYEPARVLDADGENELGMEVYDSYRRIFMGYSRTSNYYGDFTRWNGKNKAESEPSDDEYRSGSDPDQHGISDSSEEEEEDNE